LDAYLNIRSPYERVQIELMIHKLSKDFRIKCSPCHDDYANGVIGPSLLGRDGKFIYGRLMAFKTGEKKNVLMKQLVEMNDEKTLQAIANEIAEFNKQIQEMRKGRQ
jgi:cytochrome c553